MGCKSSKEVTKPSTEEEDYRAHRPGGNIAKPPVLANDEVDSVSPKRYRDSREVNNDQIPQLPSTSPLYRPARRNVVRAV